MKLNKFLVAAAAVAVLPLSVANAEETPVQPALPEFNGGVNGPGLVNEKPDYGEKLVGPAELNKDRVYYDKETKSLKPYDGVNGTGAVHDVKPYGTSAVAPLVNERPTYNPSKGTVRVDKGTEAPKADQAKRVLPKTSAVK